MQSDIPGIVYFFPANPPLISESVGDVSKRLEIHINLRGAERIGELFIKAFKACLSECGVKESVGYLQPRIGAGRARL
jgi:hypothetical protein